MKERKVSCETRCNAAGWGKRSSIQSTEANWLYSLFLLEHLCIAAWLNFERSFRPFRVAERGWKTEKLTRRAAGDADTQLCSSVTRPNGATSSDALRRLLPLLKRDQNAAFGALFYQEIGWKRATRIRLFAGNVVKVFDRTTKREFQVGTSLLVRTYLHTFVYHFWRIANSSDTAASGYRTLRYIYPQITRSNVEF